MLLLTPALLKAQTVVYPYSLIPGGVRSGEEFEAHRAERNQAYAGVGFLRPAAIAKERVMWDSYVKNGVVYWTRVKIRSGEPVLEDKYGNIVLQRCGNLVSDIPRNPVEFVPPKPQQFDYGRIEFAQEIPPDLETPPMAIAFEPPMPEEPLPPDIRLMPPIPNVIGRHWNWDWLRGNRGTAGGYANDLPPLFGRPVPIRTVSTAAPEPDSFPLAVLCLIAGWRVRSARSRGTGENMKEPGRR